MMPRIFFKIVPGGWRGGRMNGGGKMKGNLLLLELMVLCFSMFENFHFILF